MAKSERQQPDCRLSGIDVAAFLVVKKGNVDWSYHLCNLFVSITFDDADHLSHASVFDMLAVLLWT